MLGQFSSRSSKLVVRACAVFLAMLVILAPTAPALAQDAFDGIAPSGESPTDDAQNPFVDLSLKPSSTPASPVIAIAGEVNKSTPLSPDKLEALLKRLAPFEAQQNQSFQLPEQALVKPPKAGVQVLDKFPPEEQAPRPRKQQSTDVKAAVAALKILRVTPQGVINDANQIAVTFSQPMIPIAEAKDVDASAFLNLQPQPAGHWRLAGTQTLIFTPERADHLLPAATTFTLTFPQHLTSAVGGTISGAPRYSFKTPPVVASLERPVGFKPASASPLILLFFNQEIDREALLPHISLRDKARTYGLRLATAAEKEELGKAPDQLGLKNLSARRWLALKPTSPLPLNADYKIFVGVGSPSAEGPDKTTNDQSFPFTVHGVLKLTDQPTKDHIAGKTNFDFSFSNELAQDNQKLDNLVKISPRPAGFEVALSPRGFSVYGDFKPFQKYTVTIDGAIRDEFNQKLGHPVVCSWTTGPRDTQLSCSSNFVTIAPGQKPVLNFFAQALDEVKVKIYKLTAADIVKFSQAGTFNFNDYDLKVAKIPGTVVGTKAYPVGINAVSKDVDLAPYLKDGCGQFFIVGNAFDKPSKTPYLFHSFVQVTGIGIDAFRGKSNSFRVFTSSLSDGKPLADCKVALMPDAGSGTTDGGGQAAISVPSSALSPPGGYERRCLMVTRGSDTAVLNGNYSEWAPEPNKPTINWYCVSDRALYRPGDTVHVKGWQRGFKLNDDSAIRLFATGLKQVKFIATSADGTRIGEGRADVDQAGGFDFVVNLPAKIGLGELQIQVSALEADLGSFPTNSFTSDAAGNEKPSKDYSTSVQVGVQEFRRPDFEMKIVASKSSILLGESAKLTATASYFGGGDLPQTNVQWNVNANPWSYTPPNWSEFNFGNSTEPFSSGRFRHIGMQVSKKLDCLSDSHGASSVDLSVKSMIKPTPVKLDCQATFTDVNRQQWTDHCDVIVHPSKVYLGVKAEPNLPLNDHIKGSVIVVDPDGKPVPNTPVQLVLKKKNVNNESSDVSKLNLISKDKPLDYSIALPEGENFEVVATANDDAGKPNATVYSVFVNRGLENLAQKSKENESKTLTITADKPSYNAGDTARLTIASPVWPAHGLLLFSRNMLVRTQPLNVEAATTTIDVPVSVDDYPGVIVEALLNGNDYAFATGQVTLSVPAAQKKLALTVKPAADPVKPGSESTLNISLRDSAGGAVAGGHVAVAVVDESVFALREYKWPEPLDIFYPSQAQASLRDYLRKTILLNRLLEDSTNGKGRMPSALPPPSLPGAGGSWGGNLERRRMMSTLASPAPMAKPMAAMGQDAAMAPPPPPKADFVAGKFAKEAPEPEAAPGQPFAARTNFSELALFAPDVVTGEDGNATVKLKLPDSITKFRIMAAAVSGDDRSGLAESTLSTRMDLTIKPSLPRFLNFGDRCELPFVVQNQTDKAFNADVVMRVRNGSVKSEGRSVEVPANSRVEVRFPVEAVAIGSLDVQCAAVAGDLSDAANLSVPVMVPATIESFATYGQIDSGAVVQKLDFPHQIFPQVGNLSVTTSSTALQSLADAYFYLRDYGFDCSEQLSARVLAMLAMHDSLAAFGKLDDKGEATFKSTIEKSIKTMLDRQNGDGSFGLWKRGERPNYPYVALQVSRALYQAKSKGYAVPDSALAGCKKYLVEIAKHLDRDDSPQVRAAIQAYALNVRYLQNDIDAASAHNVLMRVGDDLNVEIAAWLLPVFSKASGKWTADLARVRTFVNNSIVETASTASTRGKDYGSLCYRLFYSPLRQDGIVLGALIADQPDNVIIPKLAKGLLAGRKNGAWNGTQENWVVLEALDRYFATYEKAVPDFTAHEWLNEGGIGSQKFVGRSTESHEVVVPTEYLLEHLAKEGADEITIAKDGPGRLYYRVGIEYAPKDLQLKPKTAGFIVTKTYEGVDSKDDVKKDSDGVWHFKAGAAVRCKLHFDADGDRYHVALMSPVPGGCEPVNTALAGNREYEGDSPVMPMDGYFGMWWRQWYEHQNMRDHQAEVFSSWVGAGGHDYDFMMRATAPGRFIVPPTKIEEMYQTETFGRTASETVVIE